MLKSIKKLFRFIKEHPFLVFFSIFIVVINIVVGLIFIVLLEG